MGKDTSKDTEMKSHYEFVGLKNEQCHSARVTHSSLQESPKQQACAQSQCPREDQGVICTPRLMQDRLQ